MFAAFATLVLAVAATLKAQPTLPANCDRNATVTTGDSCNSISAKHNVSTYQLADVNRGIIDEDCDNIYAGEVICLGLTGQDCQITHVVQYGNTCVQLADDYSIPVSTLLTNNPNVNEECTNLYPKEVLCVSGTIYVNSTKSS